MSQVRILEGAPRKKKRMPRLTISMDVVDRDAALTILSKLAIALPEDAAVSLVDPESRSGGNHLLPKLQGKTGEHLQCRKASIKEVMCHKR